MDCDRIMAPEDPIYLETEERYEFSRRNIRKHGIQ